MDDEAFIDFFESCALPPTEFHHGDHVRLAWLYLGRRPALEALAQFTRALRAFALAHGQGSRYHETITWAYFLLIHERRERGGQQADWSRFSESNSDLLGENGSILDLYYRPETLCSDLARRVFVFPDRLAPRTQSG